MGIRESHNVGLGKDHTLFATANGQLVFEVIFPENRKFVFIVPAPSAASLSGSVDPSVPLI